MGTLGRNELMRYLSLDALLVLKNARAGDISAHYFGNLTKPQGIVNL